MILIRISKAFKQQQQQAEIFKAHEKQWVSDHYMRWYE
jgi:hypothetical protein